MDSNRILAFLLGPFAGLFGGIAALRFHKDIKGARDIALFIMTSVSCATFLAPLIASRLGSGLYLTAGMGYVLGVFGGSLIQAIIYALQKFDLAKWANKILTKYFGG